MNETDLSTGGVTGPDDSVGSTCWSTVLAAGIGAPEALETLCETYWLPVYAFIRTRTSRDDAEDLTQGFFAEFLQRNTVASADPLRGRFRSYLLTSAKNYLANQHARRTALKRGGQRSVLSLDTQAAEGRLLSAVTPSRTPEKEFERQWALALLERALQRLEMEYVEADKEVRFRTLRLFLTEQRVGITQAEAARQLNMTPEAVRATVSRMRKRYRILLREEVAQTVDTNSSIDDELRALFQALGS